MKWLFLLLGSVIGGAARYGISAAIYQRWGSAFPYGTMVVNLTGCWLIGFFDAMSEQRLGLGPHERLFLMTGFCGAFTTFSTLILETSNLLRDSSVGLASSNLIASLAGGFLLFRLGALAGRIF